MNLSEIKKGISQIGGVEYLELQDWLQRIESPRRKGGQDIEEIQADLIRQMRVENIIPNPSDGATQPWVNPRGITSRGYLLGDLVKWKGKVWGSSHNGINLFEPLPGSPHWRMLSEIMHEVEIEE